MIVKANAKINIALNIVGKRADQYHDLKMITLPIDIYDELLFEENDNSDEICVISEYKTNDLVYKAATLLKEKYNVKQGIKITVKKNIPAMAGLGGGSSDAAFTLKTLNKIWNLSLTDDDLLKEALNIGADVAFFIVNKPALVMGFGDIIIPIKVNQNITGVVVKPCFSSSTKLMFAKVKGYIDKTEEIEKLIDALKDGKRIENLLFNDFEELDERYTDIINRLLNKGAKCATVSGSGSSVVCLTETIEEAHDLFEKIKYEYKYVKVFKMISEDD